MRGSEKSKPNSNFKFSSEEPTNETPTFFKFIYFWGVYFKNEISKANDFGLDSVLLICSEQQKQSLNWMIGFEFSAIEIEYWMKWASKYQ